MRRLVEVHSDGASASRGGYPGGWAWILTIDGQVIATASGGDASTTNNVMELTGALQGLRVYRERFAQKGDRVTLISDSRYTLGMAAGKFTPNTNIDLVSELRREAVLTMADTRHVGGHQLKKKAEWQKLGTDALLNFRCDQLASLAKQKIIADKMKEP